MKKIIFCLAIVLCATSSFAQDENTAEKYKMTEAQRDSVLVEILSSLEYIRKYRLEPSASYKLYKTENIYNLLKLNTATGQIEQLQWTLDDNEGTVIINAENLSLFDERRPGTFELYPTNNMYQFILLDKAFGRTWHVQWGLENSKRWIKRIY